jgi:predicted TIM-barrel fold metal-dependent hydrolase
MRTGHAILLPILGCHALWGQAALRGLVDSHVHYNGDKAFLEKMAQRLDPFDGTAFILTQPKDIPDVLAAMKAHPNRFVGLGSMRLDDPLAVSLVDKFHDAGFRGLGELTGPLKSYDDKSYMPVYERAEKYGMIVLFHTGIVMRPNPDEPTDVSVDRMRVTTLDNIARRFPKLTIIGAHLGNPDYAWAAEIGRWNPNLYFDLSGSTLIKLQENYQIFKSIFWWSSAVSPHTPKSGASAFEKVVFGSDIFGGEIEEFDREIERYRKMLDTCGVGQGPQANIFGGTLRKLLDGKK